MRGDREPVALAQRARHVRALTLGRPGDQDAVRVRDELGDQERRTVVARAGGLAQAREVLPRLRDDYERAYYAGIICERRAKALLDGAKLNAGSMAHILLREAKGWYEQAEKLRPPGNDDVLLRWNACARLVLRFPQVATETEERYEPYSDV